MGEVIPPQAGNADTVDGMHGAAFTGAMMMYGGAVAPYGWLNCDGASYLRTQYPALFAVIGTAFGAADGTHFNVPDFKDAFPKGTGTSTIFTENTKGARSASRAGGAAAGIGSKQDDAMQGHRHKPLGGSNFRADGGPSGLADVAGVNHGDTATTDGPQTDTTHGVVRYGYETNGKNIEVNFIIKT
jgi:microcystin-dependent protein